MPLRKAMLLVFLMSALTAMGQKAVSTDTVLKHIREASGNLAKQSRLYNYLGQVQMYVNIPEAIGFTRKAIDCAQECKCYRELSNAYLTLSYLYETAGKIDEAFPVVDSAKQFAIRAGNLNTQFFAEISAGNLFRRKAKYDSSLVHYMNATTMAEKSRNDTLMAKAYQSLGVYYTTLKDIKKAEEFHLQGLKIREKMGIPRELWTGYENLGIVYREQENYDKALYYYLKGRQYAIQENDSSLIAFSDNDIGAAYRFKKDPVNGEKYLKQSIAVRERIGEMNELAYTYNYLGENYELKNDLVNAELNIKKALAIARQIKNNKQTYEALESLSDFYARNKKYDSAYAYLARFRHFRDSLSKKDNAETIAELQTRYETEKKERKIQLQQYEINKRNAFIAGISGLLVLLGLLGYSAYKRNELKQRSKLQGEILKQQELASRAVIEAEENERKRIAGDLHDGVGQLMSAAKLNLSSIRAEIPFHSDEQQMVFDKAVALVDEGCKEVRSVSHNIMPNALLKSGLATAVRDFLSKIESRTLKINLYTEGLTEKIDQNTEIVLYRVIQECVNNVIKHSGANQLDIALIKDQDGISATIEDNGKGFNVADAIKNEGLGLKNIATRIEYLKGTVEWDAATGKGTVVAIHVPVN
jgi:signal transduction histidine kinase